MSDQSPTAAQFLNGLECRRSEALREKNSRFVSGKDISQVLGVRHRIIFDLAKSHVGMDMAEIEALLESPYYEARLGAVSIMDFQAQVRKTPEPHRKALYELYLRRHDRINNWDLVDRAAKRVIGGYLYDYRKPRDVLPKLARSTDIWERRTAMVATSYFIGKGEMEDTFAIAEILRNDPEDLIQKAVGGWIREAGKKDRNMLLGFLDKHASGMARVMLRHATEKLPPDLKTAYLKLGKR